MALGNAEGNDGSASPTNSSMGRAKYEELDMTPVNDHEEASLVPQKRRVSINTAIRLRTAVIAVSVISVIVLTGLGGVTLVGAIIDGSSSSFAFAFNAFLDSLSSMVVIWRFSGSGGSLYSVRREAIACIILGCFFFLSALAIFSRSIWSLVNVLVPISSAFLWWGSLINGIVCSILLVAKLYLAVKLESRALLTDAFNTAAGVILAISTIVGEIVYYSNSDIWQIDGIVGVVCSLALLGYGIWIVYESYHNIQREKTQSGEKGSKN